MVGESNLDHLPRKLRNSQVLFTAKYGDQVVNSMDEENPEENLEESNE